MEPQYRYCTSADGTRISFSTIGHESLPALVIAEGWTRPQEWAWEMRANNVFEAGIAEHHCVVRFDRRGVGSSQRDVQDLSLDAQLADITAVADSVGLSQFDLFGIRDGTLSAIAYAARFPDRVRHLLLWAAYLRAESTERMDRVAELARIDWGLARRTFAGIVFPNGPVDVQRRYGAMLRESMSAETAARYMTTHFDVTAFAPTITSPTLVLQPRSAGPTSGRESQDVAARIPRARRVIVSDESSADLREQVAIAREFLGERSAVAPREDAASGSAVILFIDVVDSTPLTERMGDAAFRAASRALDERLRGAIRDAGGAPVEGKVMGDGVMATFTSAREAIDAGLRCNALSRDSELRLHIGIHAGDVIREPGNVYGGAVNISSRVCDASAPGEVLVSDVVRGMARTSTGVTFEDLGERQMKGVSDALRLYQVRRAE